jgi:hypothetical protein
MSWRYIFEPDGLLVVGTAKSFHGHLDGLLLGDLGSRRGNTVWLYEVRSEGDDLAVLIEGRVRHGIGELDIVVLLAHLDNRAVLCLRTRGELNITGRHPSLLFDEGNG